MGYPQTDTAGGHLRNALQLIAGAREEVSQLRVDIEILLEDLEQPFTPEIDTTAIAQQLDAIDARITAALIAIGERLP